MKQPGLDNRHRDKHGEIGCKRGNTLRPMVCHRLLASLTVCVALLACLTTTSAQQPSRAPSRTPSVHPATTVEGVKKQKLDLQQKHETDKKALDEKYARDRSAPGLSPQARKALDEKYARDRSSLDAQYATDSSVLDDALAGLCSQALDLACRQFPPLLRETLCKNVHIPGCS